MQLNEQQTELLAKHLMVHMTPTIESAIDKKVNGKVDKIQANFDKYVELDMKWKEQDAEWKKKMEPIKELYDGGSSFFSGSKKIFAWITSLAAAIGAVWFIKDKI